MSADEANPEAPTRTQIHSPPESAKPVGKGSRAQPTTDIPFDSAAFAETAAGVPSIPERESEDDASNAVLPEVTGFELVGRLAHGGMGVVFTARETNLDREVAIKTLLPALADRTDLAAQFDREARITAKLPHPGVPPVHALGSLVDGRPFLAMKLIRGRTLHEELESIDRVAARPRLLGVFEQICQTVGYAHSVGIIHRDLKPMNVMVGAFGEVQVMDWGLARSKDEIGKQPYEEVTEVDGIAQPTRSTTGSSFTQLGRAKGTPSYMPPEQAKGDWEAVDARADVFALGGILCVLLTGSPPYTGSNVTAIFQKALTGELDETCRRLDECGADAELILLCKRCLDPDPAKRPHDGGEVASLVSAYRVGVEERARKAETERVAAEARAIEQRKRRRVQLALSGAVFAIFGLIVIGAWWQDRQSEAQKRELSEADARNARSEAARLAAEAETREQQRGTQERLQRNREAVSTLLTQTEHALRDCDSDRAGGTLEQVEKRLAEGGADDLRERLARCRTELDLLRELDRIDIDRWSLVDGKFPEWKVTAARWAKAFETFGITPGTTPDAEAARRVNEALIRERLLTSLEVWFVTGGRKLSVLGDILATADPDEFRNEARLTNYQKAVVNRGFTSKSVLPPQPIWFAVAHGQDRQLLRAYREQVLLAAYHVTPKKFSLLLALATLYDIKDKELAPRAAAWYRATIVVQPQNAGVWNNLGGALHTAGDDLGSVAALKEAIRLDPRYSRAHYNLALVLSELGDLDGAVAASKEAIRIEPNDPAFHNNLALMYTRQKRYPEALAAAREAIRLNPSYPNGHGALALALAMSGDVPGARKAAEEAIRLDPQKWEPLVRKLFPLPVAPGPWAVVRVDRTDAVSLAAYGAAMRTRGLYERAVTAYRDALALDPKNARLHNSLGITFHADKDYAAAEACYRETIRLEPKDAIGHANLALVLRMQKKYPEAIAAARVALELNPKSTSSHATVGLALKELGNIEGARAALMEAARLDPKQYGHLPALLNQPELAPPPREIER